MITTRAVTPDFSRRRILLLGLFLPLGSRAAFNASLSDEERKSEDFKQLLTRIELTVPSQVEETFLPGASETRLAKLGEIALNGRTVPTDLRELLSWHDGQDWKAPLSSQDDFRLLTITEIIDEWSFFHDPKSDFLKPWRKSWVPILGNDAGDFLVYETQGPSSGQLITYWHNDAERRIVHKSLSAWAQKLLHDIESAQQ